MTVSETRERFILAVGDQLAGADVIEVHFFAPRRQGGIESGVAVIAARLPEPVPVVLPEGEAPATVEGSSVESDGGAPAEGGDAGVEVTSEEPAAAEGAALDDPGSGEPMRPARYTVFTATYRHTLKGPDRGKWEANVKAEADAPLVTVDQVVRGVQQRAEDPDEPERLTGDQFRAIIAAHREPVAQP
ncbi:MAG TPA: hypothetical protein VG818_09380 [Gemmatimonadaceae bacterium]|jgi:hypothetical protein|nr:hypothetical protein [Gemmatimonadaceae bacterium]